VTKNSAFTHNRSSRRIQSAVTMIETCRHNSLNVNANHY